MEWIVGYISKEQGNFVFYDSYDSEEKAQKIAFELNEVGEEVWKSYRPTLTGPDTINLHLCSRETLFETMDNIGYPPNETKESIDMLHKYIIADVIFAAGKEYYMKATKYIYRKYSGNR